MWSCFCAPAMSPPSRRFFPSRSTTCHRKKCVTRGAFNLIHHASQFKADIYIASRDRLHAWALEHRRRIELEGTGTWIAPPEYVILRKLEWLREGGQDKHLRDIRFMLAATAVDRALIEAEAARLGLQPQWLQCQQSG